jgi:hypothetical protein
MTGRIWTYGVCEYCLKNSHEEVKMVRENIVSADTAGNCSEEFWVCPACGSTKKL